MWAFTRSPTRPFHHMGGAGVWHSTVAHTPLSMHTQGLVCGHLASCQHALLISPTQAASCHVFLHCTWQLSLVCFYKQVTTLFFYPSLPCVLQGTRQLPSVHVSRWQLSFTELPYVFAWYMATALTCMYMATTLSYMYMTTALTCT